MKKSIRTSLFESGSTPSSAAARGAAGPRWFTAGAAMSIAIFAMGAQGAVLNVPGEHGTIQAAIDSAEAGDTVLVAEGTYHEYDIDFRGKDITVQGAPQFGSVIFADYQGRGVVFHSGESRAAKLSNFIITLGVVGEGSSFPAFAGELDVPAGGGIRIVDSSPTISDCAIIESGTEGAGGAIAVSGGSPRIVNCVLQQCQAFTAGGIFAENSDLEVINTGFLATRGNIGAALMYSGGSVKLINNTFSLVSNIEEFDERGATVAGFGGSALIANCIFWGNMTPGNLLSYEGWSSITAQNSDVEGCGGSGSGWTLAGITDGGDNIDADPLIFNDVFLQPESPCINTGDNGVYGLYGTGFYTCILGAPRITDGRIDMGMMESEGSVDTTAPVLTTPGDLTATATSTAGAVVTFTVTGHDDVDGPVTATCTPPSRSTFPPGTTTVTCTSTDASGNTASTTFDVHVSYSWSGFLQPIDLKGSSVFKAGSTVEVKFQLTGASAGITSTPAKFSWAKVGNKDSSSVNEVVSKVTPSSGDQFVYQPKLDQSYVFNWGTKGVKGGLYEISVGLGDGVSRTVTVGLK